MPAIDAGLADLEMVRAISERFAPGVEIWAFGSRVAGTAGAHSDLDIAIMTREPLDIGVLADLKEAFSESDLPFRVDVVDWAATDDRFREIIMRQHAVLSL